MSGVGGGRQVCAEAMADRIGSSEPDLLTIPLTLSPSNHERQRAVLALRRAQGERSLPHHRA